MSRKKRVLLFGGAFALLVLLNAWFLPLRYSPAVVVERVKLEPLALIVRAAGNLDAKDSKTIRAEFDGPLNEKHYREGDTVVKDQLLAVIGRERIRQDRQQKKDMLLSAQTDLAKARKELRLQKILYKKDAVPHSSVEDAQIGLQKAEQALRSAKEGLQLSNLQWDSSDVKAPFNGTIVKDFIGDDKFVSSGREILTVADVSEFTMKARVDELEIKQVHPGQPAIVQVQIYPQTPLLAVVRDVGSLPDSVGIPEVLVELTIKDTNQLSLKPKLTAETKIFTGRTTPVMSVPLTAVSNADGIPRVWVLSWTNRIYSKVVTLGRSNPDRVEILSGLRPNERICSESEPTFADGMKVIRVRKKIVASSLTHKLLPKPRPESDKGKTKTLTSVGRATQ